MSEVLAVSGLAECPECGKREIEFYCNLPLVGADSDGVIRWHIAIECKCGMKWDALNIMPAIGRVTEDDSK